MSVDAAPTPAVAHQLQLVVYGTPIPQGSKRVVRGRVIDANQEALHAWREAVKLAALRELAITPGWDRDYPCIFARLGFTLARPKLHYRTGAHAHELRPDAPQLHTTQPDLDKLIRAVLDSLTQAGAYRDDRRVAEISATKLYPGQGPRQLDRPGVVVQLNGYRP